MPAASSSIPSIEFLIAQKLSLIHIYSSYFITNSTSFHVLCLELDSGELESSVAEACHIG